MRWLSISRPAASLTCAYCGRAGLFRHVRSYEYESDTLSLHECPGLQEPDLRPRRHRGAAGQPERRPTATRRARAARYALEVGVSSYHVAKCALAAMPDQTSRPPQEMTFIDVGAGLGLASYLMKTIFGTGTVTVEPSFTGKISHEILGLDVHRSYFEDLPGRAVRSARQHAELPAPQLGRRASRRSVRRAQADDRARQGRGAWRFIVSGRARHRLRGPVPQRPALPRAEGPSPPSLEGRHRGV